MTTRYGPSRVYYTGTGLQMLTQRRAAEEWWKREHDRLLAEGYTWDGMDGYLKVLDGKEGAAEDEVEDPGEPKPPVSR